MFHLFEKGRRSQPSAIKPSRNFNEISGKGTVSERQCFIGNRFMVSRFKFGDTSLEDKPGKVRPLDFDDQAVHMAANCTPTAKLYLVLKRV
ncbi:hypothetical protein RB195_006541 [Necator americanus]|uniref:Uncharacterized protein n=1 Tax=Necator americanus TaxID=51031 RepID=A0ABR1BT48_NECAM